MTDNRQTIIDRVRAFLDAAAAVPGVARVEIPTLLSASVLKEKWPLLYRYLRRRRPTTRALSEQGRMEAFYAWPKAPPNDPRLAEVWRAADAEMRLCPPEAPPGTMVVNVAVPVAKPLEFVQFTFEQKGVDVDE